MLHETMHSEHEKSRPYCLPVLWTSFLPKRMKTNTSLTNSVDSLPLMTDEEKFERFHKNPAEADYFAPPIPPPENMKYIYNGPYGESETASSEPSEEVPLCDKNMTAAFIASLQKRTMRPRGQHRQCQIKERNRNDNKFLLRRKHMRHMQYTSPHWKSYVFNPDIPKTRPGITHRLDQHIRNPITWEDAVDLNSCERSKKKSKEPLFDLTMVDMLYVRPCVKCRLEENVRNPITGEEVLFKRRGN